MWGLMALMVNTLTQGQGSLHLDEGYDLDVEGHDLELEVITLISKDMTFLLILTQCCVLDTQIMTFIWGYDLDWGL